MNRNSIRVPTKKSDNTLFNNINVNNNGTISNNINIDNNIIVGNVTLNNNGITVGNSSFTIGNSATTVNIPGTLNANVSSTTSNIVTPTITSLFGGNMYLTASQIASGTLIVSNLTTFVHELYFPNGSGGQNSADVVIDALSESISVNQGFTLKLLAKGTSGLGNTIILRPASDSSIEYEDGTNGGGIDVGNSSTYTLLYDSSSPTHMSIFN